MRILTNDDQLVEAGASRYRLITHGRIFAKPGGEWDFDSGVDLETLDRFFREELNRGETKLSLFDIEPWRMLNGLPDQKFAIEQWVIAARRYRSVFPDRKMGFYGVPFREYFAIRDIRRSLKTWNKEKYEASIKRWRWFQDSNCRVFHAISGMVDFVCSDAYRIDHDDIRAHMQYQHGMYEEAKRIGCGKQVIPIFNPSFSRGEKPVPVDELKSMLDHAETWLEVNEEHFGESPTIIVYDNPTFPKDDRWREPFIERIKSVNQ